MHISHITSGEDTQRCNYGEIFGTTSAGWAKSAPSGRNRVKVSENLGATAVPPVAPVVTSLTLICTFASAKALHKLPTFSRCNFLYDTLIV